MKRALLVLGFLALALVIAWRFGAFSSPEPHAAQTAPPTSTKNTQRPAANSAAKTATTQPTGSADEPSHLADALNSPNGDIRADLRIVSDVIDAFRTNFPRDGNPVGDNVEITAALTGKNKLGLQLISPRHPAINKAGELCDRWGTPFFFHAESAHKMEIRSAGPDRKMWNEDDVVYTP
jgi:hypothetical protein